MSLPTRADSTVRAVVYLAVALCAGRPDAALALNTFGACCDDATNTCVEDALPGDCERDGFRFGGAGSTCDTLDPPCDCIEASCDDGIDCTIDECEPGNDVCQHTPSDAACDNGEPCDGAEYCDAADGCQPGTPPECGAVCEDCNLNGFPDDCDITLGASLDEDLDEVPDECVSPVSGENWSDDLWALGGENPYPDNVEGVPDLHVTLTDTDVLLDVDVEIDTLHIVGGSTLRVTQEGGGDLVVVETGGILVEGNLLVGSDRTVAATTGGFAIGTAGTYEAASDAIGEVSAFLDVSHVLLLPALCGMSNQMTLSGLMTASIAGDFVMDGRGVDPCGTATEGGVARGGLTPPVLRIRAFVQGSAAASSSEGSDGPAVLTGPTVGPQTRLSVGGSFRMFHAARVCAGCDAQTTDALPALVLQGDFDNQSSFPSLFEWTYGALSLVGTSEQLFEVAGLDLGAVADGFQTDADALLDTAPHTNFAMGTIEIAADSAVRFTNQTANTIEAGACREALYVDTLILDPQASVTLDNVRLYYRRLIGNTERVDVIGCGELVQFFSADRPSPEPDATSKTRFLSFVPGSAGAETALRVHITVPPESFPDLAGAVFWVGAPRVISENSGIVSPGTSSDFPTFMAAALRCQPHFRDWGGVGLLHAYGEYVLPGTVYEIQAVHVNADAALESSFSPPLTITTNLWGDVVKDCATEPCGPADGFIGIPTDVTAIIDKFRNRPGAIIKTRADLEPAIPDLKINIADVSHALDAFSGQSYPFSPSTSSPCTP